MENESVLAGAVLKSYARMLGRVSNVFRDYMAECLRALEEPELGPELRHDLKIAIEVVRELSERLATAIEKEKGLEDDKEAQRKVSSVHE